MMNYPKLSVNDDLKIDWDDHHLVVFHFFRGDGKFLQPEGVPNCNALPCYGHGTQNPLLSIIIMNISSTTRLAC